MSGRFAAGQFALRPRREHQAAASARPADKPGDAARRSNAPVRNVVTAEADPRSLAPGTS